MAEKTVAPLEVEEEGSIVHEYRRVMYRFSFIGIEFGVALALGFLFGRWLDKKLGTAPWLMLACVVFGLGVATRDLFRLTLKERARQSRKPTRNDEP